MSFGKTHYASTPLWSWFEKLSDRVDGFKINSNDTREAVLYILILEDKFELDPSPEEKPVRGCDGFMLHLTHLGHLWARDTPIE
ncbi:hypothetical protein MMC29_001568, partial [Sticta canariensis]|nr:hypothetical protein [Sticta canariensis]